MLKIIQNARKPFSINLSSEKNDDLPLDLTGNVEITVCFKTVSTLATLTKTGGRITVDNLVLGQISGALTQAETDVMPIENNGLIEIQVDFGSGDVQKTQILNGFVVAAKAC